MSKVTKITGDFVANMSKEISELLTISPELKERVLKLARSIPQIPSEDMVLYCIKTLEYYELYALDPFDPRLIRIEQKLDFLGQKLGLRHDDSTQVKLQARQILAYS